MEIIENGIHSSKNIRKNVCIFQVGGSTPALPTPPVFRVVLLYTEAGGERLFRGSVCKVATLPNIVTL